MSISGSMAAAKDRWRLSFKAETKRLSGLEMIPDDYKIHLFKLYSVKSWSREEPFDRVWEAPLPRLLRDALKIIVGGRLRSKTRLLALEFATSQGDVENLTGLPPGWFAR